MTWLLCLLGWHEPTEIASFWEGHLTFRRTECRHCGREC